MTYLLHFYAIGDVARQSTFTHVSWEDYRCEKAILCAEDRVRSDRVFNLSSIPNRKLDESA
ncbi:hypothetical protein [Microcoleus sp. FACHB-1515]|uniref:hypothetical protein n=1 Tax=Microcoleus sp. FACHB-1515 TaxID=2692821 RepID=UPI0018EFD846|nr:hypothetical protein [Microcoleus sp. FACHB-1515]